LMTLQVSAVNSISWSTYPISWIVSRASRWMTPTVRGALVVISPATMARLVVTSVSQATRLVGSWLRQKSRTASEIWSATLSGWPMDTDSLVKRNRSLTAGSGLGLGRLATNCFMSANRDGILLGFCEGIKVRNVSEFVLLP